MPTPTTWLPPIPGLHRRDPEHRYWLGDVEFPVSVTSVTGVKSDYAMDRIEATREVWAPRGNSCHRALELFLLLEHSDRPGSDKESDEMIDLMQGDYDAWILPLITHERWSAINVIASERPTCCLTRKVAGTFDAAYIDEQGRRILADLKSLGGAVVKWRHVAAKEWAELVEVPADTAAARLAGSRVEIRAANSSTWSFLMPATGVMAAAGDSIELKVSKPSTFSTAAQLGGYMALEATWGNLYHAGQTIWCRPGQTTFSPLYSVAECRLAWAGAWATFKARASEPGFIS